MTMSGMMVCKYVSGFETPGDAGRETLPRHIPVARRQRPKTRLRCGQEQQQNETVSNSSHYPVRAPETVAAEANAQTNANRGWAGNLGQQFSKPIIGETLSSMKNKSPPTPPADKKTNRSAKAAFFKDYILHIYCYTTHTIPYTMLHYTMLSLHINMPYCVSCYTTLYATLCSLYYAMLYRLLTLH